MSRIQIMMNILFIYRENETRRWLYFNLVNFNFRFFFLYLFIHSLGYNVNKSLLN